MLSLFVDVLCLVLIICFVFTHVCLFFHPCFQFCTLLAKNRIRALNEDYYCTNVKTIHLFSTVCPAHCNTGRFFPSVPLATVLL